MPQGERPSLFEVGREVPFHMVHRMDKALTPVLLLTIPMTQPFPLPGKGLPWCLRL